MLIMLAKGETGRRRRLKPTQQVRLFLRASKCTDHIDGLCLKVLAWRKHHGVIEEGVHALLHHGQVVLVQHVLLLGIEGVHARSRRGPHVGHCLHVLQQGARAGQPIPQAAVHWRASIKLASRLL